MWSSFHVDCFENGLTILGAKFVDNTASIGGAIASDERQNAVLTIRRTSFIRNTATGTRGGAIHISGLNSAARIEDNCLFVQNRVLGAGGEGSGGAISITGNAGLRMKGIRAIGNEAIGGDGGFLFVRFASDILIRDSVVENATALGGGGGGLAIFASRVALQNISVKHCAAGSRGGGGLRLDGRLSLGGRTEIRCHRSECALRS